MLRETIVESGALRGLPGADPRVTSYKGIPYAAPPVGQRRFAPPQAPLPWDGVRDACRYGPIPWQPVPGANPQDFYSREWHVDPETPMGEDCLYLNVWTPARDRNEALPVYVWIHGGAWQVGYTSEMEFDGENLARQGVVVVTVGYRLNVFGFLAHRDLSAENPDQPCNAGLLDQRAALEWVQRNIAAFGGDPTSVTLGGQSAGGASVLHHLCDEGNRGLFHRAIVQSGTLMNGYRPLFRPRALEDAEQVGADFLAFLGVKSLEEARTVPAEWIMSRWDAYGGFFRSVELWGPVIDRRHVHQLPAEAYASGRFLDIPVLTGYTTGEFPDLPPLDPPGALEDFARERFGPRARDFLAHVGYPGASREEIEARSRINRVEAGLRSLRLHARSPWYVYRFDVDMPGPDHPGAFHSSELWFTFGTLGKAWRPFRGEHHDLARAMVRYWANFIRGGDPNGPEDPDDPLPEWAVHDEQGSLMEFRKEARPLLEPLVPPMSWVTEAPLALEP